MATAAAKYLGVWFTVIVIGAALIFFTSGSSSMLNPTVKVQYEENCVVGSGGSGGGFFDDSAGSSDDCYDAAERALTVEAEQQRGNVMSWYFFASLIPLFLGIAFAVQVALAEAKAATPTAFAALKPKWWLYFGLITVGGIIFAVLAHFTATFDAWGPKLTAMRGWGIPVLFILLSWLAYWGGTKWATPEKMQPSLPL